MRAEAIPDATTNALPPLTLPVLSAPPAVPIRISFGNNMPDSPGHFKASGPFPQEQPNRNTSHELRSCSRQ